MCCAQAGVQFDSPLPVVYAMACPFHGRRVAHLVVQTDHGPMTVMLLPHEKVRRRTEFSEDGLHGVLLPAGEGSVAVLSRDGAVPEAMAGRSSVAFAGSRISNPAWRAAEQRAQLGQPFAHALLYQVGRVDDHQRRTIERGARIGRVQPQQRCQQRARHARCFSDWSQRSKSARSLNGNHSSRTAARKTRRASSVAS